MSCPLVKLILEVSSNPDDSLIPPLLSAPQKWHSQAKPQCWHSGLTSQCNLLQVYVSCSAGCLHLWTVGRASSEPYAAYVHRWHPLKVHADFAAGLLTGYEHVDVHISLQVNFLLGPAIWQLADLDEDKESSSNRATALVWRRGLPLNFTCQHIF